MVFEEFWFLNAIFTVKMGILLKNARFRDLTPRDKIINLPEISIWGLIKYILIIVNMLGYW